MPELYGAPLSWQQAPASEPTSLGTDYVRTLRRHKRAIIGGAILGAAAGICFTLGTPSVYRARTSLDVQSLNEDFMNIRAVNPTEGLGGNSVETLLQTEIKLLQSDTLLNRVTEKLKDGPAGKPEISFFGLQALPAPFHFQGGTAPLREAELEDIASHVTVKPIGMTRLIEVNCESWDRVLASRFCNTLADEFVQQDQEGRWDTARQTISWLNRQLTEVRTRLEDSEQKLQDFEVQNKLFFTDDKESVAQSKLRLMQGDEARAEADRAAREATFNVGQTANPDSLPAVLDDEPSKQYRVKLAELERARAEASTVYTAESPEIQKLDAQIATLKESIQQARSNMVERLRNEFAAAADREKALSSSYKEQEKLVEGQIAKTAQLHMLEREAESGRQIYGALLQRVKEAGFASALKSAPVRVVDKANVPVRPVGPRRLVSGLIGSLAGLIAGVAFAFVRARNDDRLRLPGEAARSLSTREFGVIPAATADSLSEDIGKRGWRGLLGAGAFGKPSFMGLFEQTSLDLVTWNRKRSLMAEAYRAAMSSILYSARQGRVNSMVICSPGTGEGKTTVVCNLGIAFAEAGKRVLLIDADLRMPRLHTVFDLGNNMGLQQALRGDYDPVACPVGLLAQETQVPNLFVMPVGSGSSDPALLLHSRNLPALLKRLQSEFDLVLIDTPPMHHLPDARTIARLTRGMVLVLRAGVATRESASIAADALRVDGIPVLGVILNNFNPDKEAANVYYRDYYRYRGKATA